MCEYCDTQGEGNLCKTELLNLAIIGGNRSLDYEIKIKYCPMCGRKLEEKGNIDDVQIL